MPEFVGTVRLFTEETSFCIWPWVSLLDALLISDHWSPEAALRTFKTHVKGYVVWDKAVRASLMVAYTVAGLEMAVVVSEELIPMAEKEGLKPVTDSAESLPG